ncbi:MAG: hypothetical protein A2149_00815 [Candidatus Schekmanbacteria bacterium RBG_16_38_11]|uniref:Uncharacterized protein n=2 Tax=Candidatus Schekmaniibacteriota TaxID=1817811 RepID=A0A1F7R9L8_9BACT|nr:MAG: hypothetical protein A2042_08995 [Candidatus Schekmanbacteria bacterium GWA2_38_11]OGL46434.1 MAG: hypothetical protein A2149_00815 [Candidatus Schekmanbacteria bacterium RBG_16_38_11]
MLTTEKVKFVFHKALLFRGTARRFLLCQFYKPYVEKQLAKRRGSCLQCGKCCDLSVKCPLLKKKNGDISCRIYHHGRTLACRSFPIDERDLADVDFKCGYHFVN